jgi:hypothetical protein
MKRCEVCGNKYDKIFTISMGEESHFYDCFECAIHALAPKCASCGCKILGHGVEANGSYFCCAHCAQQAGISSLKDRV